MGRKAPWDEIKASVMGRIVEERDIGYLDPGIDGLLKRLNSIPQIVTTSTCMGRASIVEAESPWERGDEESRVVYKTHTSISPETIEKHISGPYCNLWLKVSPPIIHMRVKSERCALRVLEAARTSGFKHSGIISLGGESGIVVELMSGAQITAPLILGCTRIVSSSHSSIVVLASRVNETLEENRKRLRMLVEELVKNPGACASP